MSDSDLRTFVTGYKAAIIFSIVAFISILAIIFCPVIFVLSYPIRPISLLLAVVCSTLCLLFAGANWGKFSSIYVIPSIPGENGSAK